MKIKEIREKKSLNQKDLAKRAGISLNSVCRYETGARVPKANVLGKIASALECTPNDLLGVEEETATEKKMNRMTKLEDAFAPLLNAILEQVKEGVIIEMKKIDIGREFIYCDRALTREEVMEKLQISAKALHDRVKRGTMPGPKKHSDENPRWSEQTIEKYMAGEWKPKNETRHNIRV